MTRAVAVAGFVVLVEAALLAAWVVLLLHDEGWSRTVWLLLGALLFWQLRPRPARLSARAVTVPAGDAPALHRLASDVATALSVRPPARVAVDTTYPVAAYALGYLGRVTLVVGLPQWTVLGPDARLAAVTHELACVGVWRGPAGCLVRLADDLLTSARTLVVPTSVARADEQAVQQMTADLGELGAGGFVAGGKLGREASEVVGGAVLSVLAAPLRLVQDSMRRHWQRVERTASLDADRRAAALAGDDAVAAVLASTVGVPLGLSAGRSAARTGRGADPFEAFAAARPDRSAVRERLARFGEQPTDDSHPTVEARVAAAGAATPAPGGVDRGVVEAADTDVVRLRERLRTQLVEELVHGRP